MSLIRRVAPNLHIHGSTQMSITSAQGAEFAAGNTPESKTVVHLWVVPSCLQGLQHSRRSCVRGIEGPYTEYEMLHPLD